MSTLRERNLASMGPIMRFLYGCYGVGMITFLVLFPPGWIVLFAIWQEERKTQEPKLDKHCGRGYQHWHDLCPAVQQERAVIEVARAAQATAHRQQEQAVAAEREAKAALTLRRADNGDEVGYRAVCISVLRFSARTLPGLHRTL